MNQHIVNKGESLWQIAQMHGLSLQDLIDANPQIEDPNQIVIGEMIFVPDLPGHIPEPPTPNRPPLIDDEVDIEDAELCKRLAALPRPLIYVVRSGDTLYKIAKCFDISLKELLKVNPQIKNPDFIQTSDKIFVPRPRQIDVTPPAGSIRPEVGTCPYCGRKL